MRIGYPCRNLSLSTKASQTFRLKSYSDERLIEVVSQNLAGLRDIFAYNIEHGLLHSRITSDIVPFASHPVCTMDWRMHFAVELAELGKFAQDNGIRFSMHPGQYVLLNSPTPDIVSRSIAELQYHVDLLDLLGADESGKIQIHVGGVYGEKEESIKRFITEYQKLPESILRRLAIENDERQYSLAECLEISSETGVPIIFDVFHHSIYNNGESVEEAFAAFTPTWKDADGPPMVDYSSQDMSKQRGAHTASIVIDDFRQFVKETLDYDFDVMLEIKDKETSALAALKVLREVRGEAPSSGSSLATANLKPTGGSRGRGEGQI